MHCWQQFVNKTSPAETSGVVVFVIWWNRNGWQRCTVPCRVCDYASIKVKPAGWQQQKEMRRGCWLVDLQAVVTAHCTAKHLQCFDVLSVQTKEDATSVPGQLTKMQPPQHNRYATFSPNSSS
jgi:hypothetical protein